MNKEEQLRQEFIDETKAKLWAEDINKDVGFSDKYVEWLEQQLLIQRVSQQRELLKAYFEWEQKQDMNIESYQKGYLIDEFLDSL